MTQNTVSSQSQTTISVYYHPTHQNWICARKKKKSPLTLLDSKFNMVQKSSSVAKHIMRFFFLFHEKILLAQNIRERGGGDKYIKSQFKTFRKRVITSAKHFIKSFLVFFRIFFVWKHSFSALDWVKLSWRRRWTYQICKAFAKI